jgi:DNA invertase Pin-like site-specific DNA recombinase
MSNAAKAVACYVRVSTAAQDDAGQRAEITRWLEGNGIVNVRWFTDKKSGKTLKRPAFTELQKAVFNGEVSTVVVYKLDRLSRSLRDGLNTLCDWCERGLPVVSVTQQLDWNGKLGQMLAGIFFGLAEMEYENRRESQADGIAAKKKANGGKCPWGGRTKGTFKVKPQRARELAESGLKPAEIANALGVSRMSVHNYLKMTEQPQVASA